MKLMHSWTKFVNNKFILEINSKRLKFVAVPLLLYEGSIRNSLNISIINFYGIVVAAVESASD